MFLEATLIVPAGGPKNAFSFFKQLAVLPFQGLSVLVNHGYTASFGLELVPGGS